LSRRFIPISDELISRAIRIAERLGIPFRTFIERALESLLDVIEYNPDLMNTIAFVDAIWDLVRISGILLPRDVVYKIIERSDEETLRELERELRKVCRWYSTLVKVKRGADLKEVKPILSLWFPDTAIDITTNNSDSTIRIVLSSPNQPEKVSRLAAAVLEEFLRGLGYRVIEVRVSHGVVSAVVSQS